MYKYLDPEGHSLFIEHFEFKQPMNMSENHSHNSYEIYYQMSGCRNHFVGDKFYSTKKGEIIIIEPNIPHKSAYAGIKTYQRFVLYLNPGFFSDFDEFAKNIKFLEKIDGYVVIEPDNNEIEKIENLFFNILEEYNTQPQNYEINLELLTKELLIRLNRCYSFGESSKSFAPNTFKIISNVCLYLQMNCKNQISLSTLAEEFKLSPFYLSRKFKKITKCSIPQYLNKIRILISKELLKTTDLTITEIALEVGYANSSNFTRVFKNHLNITPQQYRKMQNKN